MQTEAQKRAVRKYDKKTVQVSLRFRKDLDADIIERLESVPAKTSYIRDLIRSDIG